MDKPKKEDYGWEEPTLGEPGGWCIEGGEEEYGKALIAWEKSKGSFVLTEAERLWIEALRSLLANQPDEIYLYLDPGYKISVRKFSRQFKERAWRYDAGHEHTHIYVDHRFDLDEYEE